MLLKVIRLRNYVARIHLNYMIHNIEDCLVRIYPIIIIINFTLILIQYFGLDFDSLFVNDSVQNVKLLYREGSHLGPEILRRIPFYYVSSCVVYNPPSLHLLHNSGRILYNYLTVHVLVNQYGNYVFVCYILK